MTDTKVRKKLIEVAMPLEAINAAAVKEKSIRHGHPSTLHLWWARRPLAACRAVLFAQLVDDPSAWPDRFPTPEEQATERQRLHDLIAEIVPWEASNNVEVQNKARWEIARSIAWGNGDEPPPASDPKAVLDYLQAHAPPIYDPFCGGGSIPLEAQRLGLRAIGSDLNPVAVLISKALVEIPPKFAGRAPVNPEAQAERLVDRSWTGACGLANDVQYYGRWMRQEAEHRLGHLYPKVRLPDGSEATVIAWLWARTVRSPDPAARGAHVPLVSSFMLSTKAGKQAWVEPVLDRAAGVYRFHVQTGNPTAEQKGTLKLGTKGGKGQAFVCLLTGSPIPRDYIQAEGKAGHLGERLLAVIVDACGFPASGFPTGFTARPTATTDCARVEGARSRLYLDPSDGEETLAHTADANPAVNDARQTFLAGNTPTRAMITGGVCSAYGLSTWGHLFTPRQLVALTTFSDLVGEVREQVLSDARSAGLPDDPTALHAGGTGATAYADSIETLLALALDRCVMAGNTLVRWNSVGAKAQHAFGRQALAMTWDYAEVNFLAHATGSFSSAYEMVINGLLDVPCGLGAIHAIDAPKNSYPVRPVVISTDPPYYDNIGYAVLSDFFYVWLRRSFARSDGKPTVWPNLFRTLLTPKAEELVATPYRHGGKARAEAFFIAGMSRALHAMCDASVEAVPLTIYYAFKQSEAEEDGITSPGWASFLQAVVDSGLAIDGTWPLRTELASRMIGMGANALASSIVLVCRKRSRSASTIEREDFVRVLRRELPDALAKIRAGSVGPVDMAQAAIGPGMGVFTRYAAVLEDSGEAMKVRTALALINQARDEIDSDDDASYDLETRFALEWFGDAGWDLKESGRAILAANARDLSLDGLIQASIITTQGGKTRLIRREEMPINHDPTFGKEPIVWNAAQHLARALTAEDGGQDRAAAIMEHLTGREAVRALAYRLYGLCERKNWASEALVWNRVAEEWRAIEDRAATMPRDPAAAQDLFEAAR